MKTRGQGRPIGLAALILLVAGFFLGSIAGAQLIAYTTTKMVTTTHLTTVSETLPITITTSKVVTLPTTITTELTTYNTVTAYNTTLITTTETVTAENTVTINHTVTIANRTVTTTITNATTIVKTKNQIERLCFSRYEYCLSEILSNIKSAARYIYVMAYLITSDDIADALIDAHNRGVNVKVIIEKDMINISGSDYKKLKDAGIDVRVENTSYLMHHKVIIVDGKIVITGSYNFSRAAEDDNYENLLVITDPEIVSAYEQEFGRILQNCAILP